jgi:hypothetical protein
LASAKPQTPFRREMSLVYTLTVLTCTIYGCATQKYGAYRTREVCLTATPPGRERPTVTRSARRVFDDRVFFSPRSRLPASRTRTLHSWRAGGTDSSQTRRWRERDSNFRFRVIWATASRVVQDGVDRNAA